MLTHGTTCRNRNGAAVGVADVGLVVSPAERSACFRIVHDQYVARGYSAGAASGRRVLLHHALPTTTMFRAMSDGSIVGTVTLVADSLLGLPMDAVYAAELRPLRITGRRLAEVAALAVAPDAGASVVVSLMSLLVLYAEALGGVDDLCVTVHPRHARFYERLGFARLGAVKPYAAVNGAPAVALRLDLSRALATRDERRACARRFLVGGERVRTVARLRDEEPRSRLTSREFVQLFVGQAVLDDAPASQRALVQSFHSDLQLADFVAAAGPGQEVTVLGSA